MTGFSFNKALFGGIGSGIAAAFFPALLGLIHLIEPAAAAVNPILGATVGVFGFIVTWFAPKNKTATASPPPV